MEVVVEEVEVEVEAEAAVADEEEEEVETEAAVAEEEEEQQEEMYQRDAAEALDWQSTALEVKRGHASAGVGDARDVEYSTPTERFAERGALFRCEDGSRLWYVRCVCTVWSVLGRLYSEAMRFSVANICPLFRASASAVCGKLWDAPPAHTASSHVSRPPRPGPGRVTRVMTVTSVRL